MSTNHPWADPNLQRPCTDKGSADWPAAFAVAKRHMAALRSELSGADSGGGFWQHVATDEQTACQWAWVIDGGAYGGSLSRALQSRGVFTPAGGQSAPAATNLGGVAAQPIGPSAGVSGQVNQLMAQAQRNPLLVAGVVGAIVLLLTRK